MAGLPFVLSVALAAVTPCEHRAVFTSPTPACDALGLSDEDGEAAARDVALAGDLLTPAGGFDERDCMLPDKAPAVIDCNDARDGLWVGGMIGTCDMPVVHWHPSLHALPRDHAQGHDPSLACAGPTCLPGSHSARPASRFGGDQPWLLLGATVPMVLPTGRRLVPPAALTPRSIIREPDPRPPSG